MSGRTSGFRTLVKKKEFEVIETILGLVCLLCLAVAVIALVCRQRAFAERDEARREATEWQAVAFACEEGRHDRLRGMRDIEAARVELVEDLSEADDSTRRFEQLYRDEARRHRVSVDEHANPRD